jgi:hypothetical protein
LIEAALVVLIIFLSSFFISWSWRLGVIAAMLTILPLLITSAMMVILKIHLKSDTTLAFNISAAIASVLTLNFLPGLQASINAGSPGDSSLKNTFKTLIISSVVIEAMFLALQIYDFKSMANIGLIVSIYLPCFLFLTLTILPALRSKSYSAK